MAAGTTAAVGAPCGSGPSGADDGDPSSPLPKVSAPEMKSKRRKPTNVVAALPDDILADILLRLPSPASIIRAALSFKHWRRVASSPGFLRRLRAIHPFPPLLGHFLSDQEHSFLTHPLFRPMPRLHFDPVLAAVVRRSDFLCTRLQYSHQHELEDCRHGLLLFSGFTELTILDPVAHRVVSVSRLPIDDLFSGDTDIYRVPFSYSFYLLPESDDNDNAAPYFRVIALLHIRDDKRVHTAVYDSRTGDWRRFRPRAGFKKPASYIMNPYPAMHAAGHIYWKFEQGGPLLSLNSETLEFAYVHLPPGVPKQSLHTVGVGETEDGECCLVYVGGGSRMHVWLREEGGKKWKLQQQAPVPVPFGVPGVVSQVRAVVAGLVVVSMGSHDSHQVAFRLKSLEVEAEFFWRGLVNPYLMAWPPALLPMPTGEESS